jgi:tetratricopeptide (TPR) repeat protein
MSKPPKHKQGRKPGPTSPQTSSVDAAFQQAVTLHRTGQAQQAAAIYQQIINSQPDHFDALTMYAMLMSQHGHNEGALQLVDRALQVNPASAEAWLYRGNVLKSMRRFEEALANYDHAQVLKPDFAEAHFNQGVVLQELKRSEEALALFDRALKLKRNYAQAWNARGDALTRLSRHEEALASLDRALKYQPDFAESHYNRGTVLYALGHFDEALASWRRAQAIKPDYALAHYNEGLCHLLLGNYERGWQQYEWRWQAMMTESRRPFSQPLWLGREEIVGKTILLHAEQGFGDTIQFCRYAQHVASLGATVLLEVQPALVSLLERLESPARVLARGEPLPDFDFHTPLLSLPLACMTTLGTTIPAQTTYLTVPADKLEAWRNEIGTSEGVRVGLVWSGSLTHTNDPNRTIPLAELAPLLEIEQVMFVSLQKEVRDNDRTLLMQSPIVDYSERLQDFADTAALIDTLDLVITVDTSVAHLAGALGKPVWILLPHIPDWRWLLERTDSPWYPTARLYRQPRAADWQSVVRNVTDDLRGLC